MEVENDVVQGQVRTGPSPCGRSMMRLGGNRVIPILRLHFRLVMKAMEGDSKDGMEKGGISTFTMGTMQLAWC